MPHFPAIEGGTMPVGSIDAPDALNAQPPSAGAGKKVLERKQARATRVVGQLDHPVLPEPPVRSSPLHRSLMRTNCFSLLFWGV